MKIVLAALVATTALTSVAHAADKPVIGPAPGWVKPLAPPTAAAKTDEAPIRILLSDQQVALESGRQTVYSETVLKIQTPQGLAAGNISLPWRPDTDTLTVHKLLIRRGDQIIDVLKSGQTFTVLRREQNLESATLDGVLTANIQPEGLQVGDILEFSMSVSSSDPTLKGHVEQMAGAWNGLPIGRAHLRMQWPTTLPARVRQTGALPALKPTKTGSTSIVEVSLDNVAPIVPPKGAPARYSMVRLVEVTDFASWADLGALMAPLYEKAAVIAANGALRTELERIQSLSPDPKVRAEAALALVQDRVRYVALAMGAGGYVPADAETTWSRRYGDCKGKTALLLALLHSMNIQAEPVAVSTTFGDGLDARLPMVGLFNHVLVKANVGGRAFWMDGTRNGDSSLDRLTTPNFGWGLPLVATGAELVRMLPAPPSTPTQDTTIRIDASAGISAPAPIKVETILRGDEAIGTKVALANLVGEARDQALKEYWKNQYDFVDVKMASASFDPKTGEQRLVMEGEAKLDWASGTYQTDGTNVGYRADFSRDPGNDKDAPFAVAYPYFNRTRETIVLPRGFGDFKLGTGMEVDQKAGGIEYKRHAAIADGVFTIEKSERSVVPEFPAKDAPAEQAALRMLADRPASIRMPTGYSYTGKDLAAAQAQVPTTSEGYVNRARIFIDRGMRKEALADYDKAVELDPTNVYAWANRSMTRVENRDLSGAKADLVKAEALDPTFNQNFIVRGMLAEAERRPKAAIEPFTNAIAQDPENSYPIGHRALCYAATGDMDKAFADAAAALKLNPGWIDLYSLRAEVYLRRGDREHAIAEMRAAVADDPQRAFSHVAAARVYAAADHKADALVEYDRAIALEPLAYIYAERSKMRAPDEIAARQADIDAALKLDPKSNEALAARAALQQNQGDTKAAIATLSLLIASSPDNVAALFERAEAYRRAGDYDRALADTGAALKREPKAIDFYLLRANLFKAQGKVEDALREAVAAEAADQDNAYAHVVAARIFSTFHKDADAIKAYDRAIAIKPEAYIYVNRSTSRPKTDVVGRRADLDAAFKLDPYSPGVLVEKASLQSDSGDVAGALATYSAALEQSPEQVDLLVARGIVYARSGDAIRAAKDFTGARAKATEAVALNNMCWAKAIAGVALDSALTECNAALAKAPETAGYLDSRGLVLLRLGRVDDAIADYDRALFKRPDMASSLFGRAIAWARKGNRTKSDADSAAALKIDPDVRTDFDGYGVKL